MTVSGQVLKKQSGLHFISTFGLHQRSSSVKSLLFSVSPVSFLWYYFKMPSLLEFMIRASYHLMKSILIAK